MFALGALAVIVAIFVIPLIGLFLAIFKWYVGGLIVFALIMLVIGLAFGDGNE